ncbi:two-component system response regulator [Legionella impletisoli]|uniref:Diguanylate cyclase response regulator n=1 Tax=Legionella impletisoli TaxID=343510 RepID=A0A917N8M2_9GAMM|nr:diguanylate cyclase [Legionella impletisoli]GGI78220.1 diguanylate cyclase response regulator [Legionella impletisoli]
MNILIADDSKLTRKKLSDALNELGHQVLEATSGEDAIALFQSEHPDLIILDVVMEGMSGFECARKLRALNQSEWIPIIFLSSSIDDEYISKGIDAGGDDYLTKPISKVTLAAKIKAMQRIADMRSQLIDITEKLKVLSRTDPLTGLNNRLEFDKVLEKTIARAERHQLNFALLFIDIDGFKGVNDTLGHHAGDELIKQIANRLASSIRIDDFIARLGGDEFAIIMQPIKTPVAPEKLAEKIVTQNVLNFQEDRTISLSVGIATYPEAGTSREKLLIHADEAMYQAKQQGGKDYRRYTETV